MMFKRNWLKRFIFWEVVIIIFPLIWFFLKEISSQPILSDLVVNSIFLILFMVSIISRNPSFRHFYYALIFLTLSIIGDVLGFEGFVYLSSSLTLSFLILGMFNMIVFKRSLE